jgi:hypothetical protein
MATKSYGSQKDSWFKLLANVLADKDILPDFSAYTSVLAEMLEETRNRGARVDERRALKQQETKDHRERMKVAAEAAARLRAALRGFWGFTNPILLKYGINPITQGKRRNEPVTEAPEQPQPETPAPAAPESQPAPQGAEPSKSEGPAPQTEPRSS